MKPDLTENTGVLRLHPSYRASMRKILLSVAVLTLGLVLAWTLPAVPGVRGIAGYTPLHTLLETVSIVIAMLIFALGWNAYSTRLPGNIVLLAGVFFSVGLLDFAHLLSYAGMPDFVTASGPEKAINFWLAARLLAGVALFLIAIRSWQIFTGVAYRYTLFSAMFALTLLLYWLFLLHPESLPRTFIAGQGLTALKIYIEYAIIALNIVTAVLLWLRMRSPQPFNVSTLFGAVCDGAERVFLHALCGCDRYFQSAGPYLQGDCLRAGLPGYFCGDGAKSLPPAQGLARPS